MASFTLKLSHAALEGVQVLIDKLLAVVADQMQSEEFPQGKTTLQQSSDSLSSATQERKDQHGPHSFDIQLRFCASIIMSVI